jgi:hypothetical protein
MAKTFGRMRRIGVCLRAAGVLGIILVNGCALLVSFSGYSGGSDVGDAGADAEPGPEGDAAQPIALVQSVGSDFIVQTASQASQTFGTPNTPGNTLIVLGFWQTLGFAATVTDSVGNTYESTPVAANPDPQTALQIFYVPRAAAAADGGNNAVTITMASGFNSYVGLAIFEYTGLAGANVLEGSAEQAAPVSTQAATTPTVTTSSPRSLLFAAFADEEGSGIGMAGTGWTALAANPNFYMIAEAKIVATPGKFSATATLPSMGDDQWVGLLAAFVAEE